MPVDTTIPPAKRGRPKKTGKRVNVRLDADLYAALPRDRTDKTNQIINEAIRDFLKKN